MLLSDNFSLAEAMKSQTALRLEIDNTPRIEIMPALIATAKNILQPVRDHFDIGYSPSSWFRNQRLNTAIGSRDTSQHIAGEAVDFELPGVDNMTVAAWIRDNLTFDQLILEFWKPGEPAAGWVHCSFVENDDNRGQVLRINGNGTWAGLA